MCQKITTSFEAIPAWGRNWTFHHFVPCVAFLCTSRRDAQTGAPVDDPNECPEHYEDWDVELVVSVAVTEAQERAKRRRAMEHTRMRIRWENGLDRADRGVDRVVALEEVGDEILEALGLGEKAAGESDKGDKGRHGWAWEV